MDEFFGTSPSRSTAAVLLGRPVHLEVSCVLAQRKKNLERSVQGLMRKNPKDHPPRLDRRGGTI